MTTTTVRIEMGQHFSPEVLTAPDGTWQGLQVPEHSVFVLSTSEPWPIDVTTQYERQLVEVLTAPDGTWQGLQVPTPSMTVHLSPPQEAPA